jgi:hypothetical protein
MENFILGVFAGFVAGSGTIVLLANVLNWW